MSARAWFLTLFAVAVVLAVVGDVWLVGDQHRPEFWGSGARASFAVLGLVGCVAIIVASKWLGHYLLMREEDYYEGGDEGHE